MNRTYLLPVFATVTALGSACGSSIEGSWDLTERVYDGTTYAYPYTTTEVDDGVTYTYTTAISMLVNADETVSLTATYTYSVAGESGNTETDDVERTTYSGAWSKGDNKTYAIVFDEDWLSVTCTLEDGDLDCDDGAGLQLLFSPADE